MRADRPALVLLGSEGLMTATVFDALLRHGLPVAAVILPRTPGSPFPIVVADSLAERVLAAGITVLRAAHIDDSAIRRALREGPRALLVACSPWRVPNELIALATLGGFNLHPAMLPGYRGPAPLFWQFRDGLDNFGVTLHRLTDRLDAGPIIAARQWTAPDGARGSDVLRRLMQAGAAVVADWWHGDRNPRLERRQHEVGASYQGNPGLEDFRIEPGWSSRRVYRFVRGVAGPGVELALELNGRSYRVLDALRRVIDASETRPGMDPVVRYQASDGAVILSVR